jgi:hypothetical protein
MDQLGSSLGTALKGAFTAGPQTVGAAGASDLAPLMGDAVLAAKGGPISGEKLAAKGMKVPGQAKVAGNSLKNDTVPAMLSPGEIVLPRDVVNHPDAPNKAAQFVQAIQAKQGLKRKRA